MALINFSREDFVNAVADGSKHFTIRQLRKNPVKKGETLQLYTGLRTKQARKLREAVCKNVGDIKIENTKKEFLFWLDNKQLSLAQVKDISNKIGFDSVDEWIEYFKKKYKFPFKGQLIEWE
ncbi:MAG TPA: hypothetical protein VH396_10340 [Chitinophagaceae bacterium]|jgi:hypothetical protein